MFSNEHGDRWSFVGVLPDTGFIQAVHHGKRTKEEAKKFLEKIKRRSDGLAALFISDGWFYEDALYETYGSYVTPPYKGRGPYPKLKLVPDVLLKYAQVIKDRDVNGSAKKIVRKIIKGDKDEILAIIKKKVAQNA